MRATATVADVAVGVATLDRPEGLARCLDALLSGDVRPAEIIVVDQGSTGGAEPVVRAREGRGVPIHLTRQARRGLSASRNAAIAMARASVVAVTDDDCVPDRRWVASLMRTFASPEAPDAVTGRVLPLGPEAPGQHAVSSRVSLEPRLFVRPAPPWDVGTGANFAVRRTWLDRVGYYDERLGAGTPGQAAEDMDLIHRLLRSGARIRYEPAAVVYHERQPLARRVATRATYGFGAGALCGLCLRRHDAFAAVMLADFAAIQIRGLIGALVRARRPAARERLIALSALPRGLAYGWRLMDVDA